MRVQANQPRERKFYKLSGFKGVDYSSSPLEVNPRRATDINNLLLEDGVLHKRNGWEQKIKVGNERINGIWSFSGFDIFASQEGRPLVLFLIVQSGGTFYYIAKIKGQYVSKKICEGLEDKRSYCFYAKDKFFLFNGSKCYEFAFISEEQGLTIVRVSDNNSNAYIPVTTIDILPRDSAQKTEAKVIDPPNMLLIDRKNQLIGEPASRDLYYVLDAVIADTKDPTLINEAVSVSITDVVGEKRNCILYYSTVSKKWTGENNQLEITTETIGEQKRSVLKITKGYNPFSEISSGLDKATIIVQFRANDVALDQARKNFRMDIAILFGVNGASDRVFLGNFYNNKVYFSAKDDFTYFPSDNVIACGGSNSSVSAFERLGDGTLAVFKKSFETEKQEEYGITAETDATVCYITGSFKNLTETVADGDSKEVFSVTAGSIGESCIAPYAVANLAGDPLMVSRNGVHGIVLSNNVATSERYARERSRPVNAKLEKLDLSDSSAIVYRNQYYLSVGGKSNECYVADARYKYTIQGDMDDTFNYEWFRLTNIPARVWAVIENELWFGTVDGWLCRFTDGYSDIYKTATGEATVAIDENGRKYVTFSNKLYSIVSKSIYAIDESGKKWPIEELTETSFSVPLDVSVEVGAITLRFAVPVYASWHSPILDFNASVYRKCLWSMSAGITPVKNGNVAIGYKTRQSIGALIPVEGAEIFDFGDIDFKRFSFDCGGFISAFRQRVFARDFVYLQVMFEAADDSDCVVNEITLEYTITTKNIGVG